MNTVLTHTPRASGWLGARSILTAMRPRQWPKNLLVFGAPAAAGVLFVPEAMIEASLAFLAFTLAACGTYLVNDAVDAASDRLHPVKRNRPVAAGVISRGAAVVLGVVFLATALIPTAVIGRGEFTATIVTYVLLTLAYSLWLKQLAVVDIVVVAAGFGLRALGGAFAIDVPVSHWFLIVSFFGALFVVSGKRFGERQSLGDRAGMHRSTLSDYAEVYTQHVMTLSSGITLVGYSLWAHDHGYLSDWWFLVSLMLLVMTLLRFALLVHAGASDDPVEIAWNDVPLRVMALVFLVLVVTPIQLS